MNKRLTHKETLTYYDQPVLFVCDDKLGVKYLCTLVDCAGELNRYLCMPISPQRLGNFLAGEIELQAVFNESETDEYYVCTIDPSNLDQMVSEQIARNAIPPQWFPEKGFVYEKPVSQEILNKEAVERQRGIIHLILNPPESRVIPKIRATILAEAIQSFQKLIKYSYKRSINKLEDKHRLDDETNYSVEVFGFAPGSFTLHIQSSLPVDALGYSEIYKAMTRIDEITSDFDSRESSLNVLKDNKGHIIKIYKNLLRLVIENDTEISYDWATPDIDKTYHRRISKQYAQPIYDLLQERQELDVEMKELLGVVMKADVDAGSWTLLCEDDGKKYRGYSDDKSPRLTGITLEETKYKFTCEERIEEEIVSGRESTKLFLVSFLEL